MGEKWRNLIFLTVFVLTYFSFSFGQFCMENSHCAKTGYCNKESEGSKALACNYGICTCPKGTFPGNKGDCVKCY